MGCRGLDLAVIAASCLFVFLKSDPAYATGAALSAIQAGPSLSGVARIEEHVLYHHHRRRVQSSYCYPRNYWWFYRPYTTGLDGHARCMPYFHYLGPDGRRGAGPDRYIK